MCVEEHPHGMYSLKSSRCSSSSTNSVIIPFTVSRLARLASCLLAADELGNRLVIVGNHHFVARR